MHPLHPALATSSAEVSGSEGIVIVGICFAGTRKCLFLAIYVPFPLPERIRSSRILTKPRPGRRGGGVPLRDPFQADQRISTPAIIVVRRAEAEASLRSLRSGGNEVSKSLPSPSELHPTSMLSEMVHDGVSRASLGLDQTR